MGQTKKEKRKRCECFVLCVSLVALMSFMLTPWRSPWRNGVRVLYFRGRIGDELRKVRINATSPRGVPVLEVMCLLLCVFLSVDIRHLSARNNLYVPHSGPTSYVHSHGISFYC